MGTRTQNGGKPALAVKNGAQHPLGYDAIEQKSAADTAALRLVLAATEQRFAASQRQLERMRRRDALLEQQVALLEEWAAKAQRFAYHDELTGLPNRHLLIDRFHQAAALAARHDTRVGLLFLDLDGFKYVNDTLGHSAGDKLLQQIAERLIGCIRTSDTGCRYGGDEFVVLLPEISGKGGAVVVANNIRVRLEAPYIIEGAAVTVTISLGKAVYPIDAHAFDELIQLADLAMYRHKARRARSPIIVTQSTAARGAGASALASAPTGDRR